MHIRRAVQRGQVEQATELVNDLNPEVSFFFLSLSGLDGKLGHGHNRALIYDHSTMIILYYAPLSANKVHRGCNDFTGRVSRG